MLRLIPKRQTGSLSPNDMIALVIFGGIAQDSPTLLAHNGVLLSGNLRREKLTEEELLASLRKQGIAGLEGVRQAVLELDGRISVLKKE